MAYTITLAGNAKRINSTRQWYLAYEENVICNLKTPCDMLAPTFTYQGDFPRLANYFYVAEWYKYFWITSIVFDSGHWTFTGKLDVLATYKDDIGDATAFIERAESLPMNHLIPDPMLTVGGGLLGGTSYRSMGFSAAGSYILTVAGASETCFWALNEQRFQSLYKNIFSADFCNDIAGAWKNVIDAPGSIFSSLTLSLRNEVLNPSQYIQDIIWIPYDVTTEQPTGQVKLGFTDGPTGHPCSPSELVHTDEWNMIIPAHPRASEFGDWLNTGLGRKATLSIPGIGTIDLDLSGGGGSSTLSVKLAVDVSGTIYADVSTGMVHRYLTGSLGVSVGVMRTQSHFASGASSVITGGIAAAAGGATGLLTAANGIINMLPKTESISAGGSRAIVTATPNMTFTYQYTNIVGVFNPARNGYLCMTHAKIGDLSGYIKCRDASILSASTEADRKEINDFLNGGFYYE